MEYLTVAEIARRLKVHPRTVKRWLNAGSLKGKLLSDRAGWRVSEAELRRFMENGDHEETDTASDSPRSLGS